MKLIPNCMAATFMMFVLAVGTVALVLNVDFGKLVKEVIEASRETKPSTAEAETEEKKEPGIPIKIIWSGSPVTEPGDSQTYTKASYYSEEEYPGGIMANGRPLDDTALTCAAGKEYPFNTILEVTCIKTGKSVRVRVTDRGPAQYLRNKGRTLDLTKSAFARIAPLKWGVISVRYRVISKP